MKILSAILFLATAPLIAQSKWASIGPDGHLHYSETSRGDHIPDYSISGYEGGGVALPQVPATIHLSPGTGDDTAAIQSAIDKVSAMPLKGHFRDAVQLSAGTFHCSGTLHITSSGVVLRGAGEGKNGTIIEMTGAPHRAMEVTGKRVEALPGAKTNFADAYVPFGTRTVHVSSTEGFHVGDTVRITKPVTPEWIAFMGMDKLTRPGRSEHWIGDAALRIRRRIIAMDDNAMTFDVALMDSYDAKFTGPVPVERVDVVGQIDHVGVEGLYIKAPARSIALEDPHYDGIFVRDAVDSWLQHLELEDVTDGLRLELGTQRITVARVDVTQHKPITSSAKNFQFTANGSQLLFDRITGSGKSVFYMATQAREQGPVVVLHCHFEGDGRIEPHQRWATGLLIDNCEVPHGGINMVNRGIMGSGHGWTIGWPVVWNSSAAYLTIQQPPGTLSWSIGNRGEQQMLPIPTADRGWFRGKPLPQGIIESQGKPVKPQSLYLEQLYERLGPQALKNIGYTTQDR
ncbi:MAG: hypothetical protein JSS87_14300 [Acidobacteria bacterium]|nr:hypothetical protein [Acidobacteriota bacterium]